MRRRHPLGAGSVLTAAVLEFRSVTVGLAASQYLISPSVPLQCSGLATQLCAKPHWPSGGTVGVPARPPPLLPAPAQSAKPKPPRRVSDSLEWHHPSVFPTQ